MARTNTPATRLLGLLVLAAAATLLLPSAAAGWMQTGYDGANTGHLTEPGPQNDDVVFRLQLERAERSRLMVTPPLIVNGTMYALERYYVGPNVAFNPDEVRIHALDLATADQRIVATFPTRGYTGSETLAYDSGMLLLLDRDIIYGVDPTTGTTVWTTYATPLPGPMVDDQIRPVSGTFTRASGAAYGATCEGLAIQSGSAYTACIHGEAGAWARTLRGIDTLTGAVVFDWIQHADATGAVGDNLDYGQLGKAGSATGFPSISSVAVDGDTAMVVELMVQGAYSAEQASLLLNDVVVHIIDVGAQASLNRSWSSYSRADEATDLLSHDYSGFGQALLLGGQAFIEGRSIYRLDTGFGASDIRDFDHRPGGPREADGPTGMATDRDLVFVTSKDHVTAIDRELRYRWQWPAPDRLGIGAGGLAVDEHCVYVTTQAGDSVSSALVTINCLDPQGGGAKWARDLGPGATFAVAEGLLVAIDSAGSVTVIGTTNASIGIEARANTRYPTPGRDFAVDLSNSTPGAFGPATTYSADWGDGTHTEWQASPRLAHRYSLSGDYTARLWAANDAGQVSSIEIAVFAGAVDPGLKAYEVALLPENQERTFFLLGLAATILLAGLGILRWHIRHRRMQRLLADVEEVYQRHRDNPDTAQAVLADRRAHVRKLLLSGRIDESHLSVVERRIDELHRTVRMNIVDQRFQHLPHGMVKRLNAILEDGRVTQLERSHFLEMLEREHTLPAKMKRSVQQLIDTWFAADSARARTP